MKVPYKYDSPVLHDEVIQDLQTALEDLGWIQKAFPAVRLGSYEQGTVPLVYLNDGTPRNEILIPDTKVQSFSFFEVLGVNTPDPEDEDFLVYELGLVVWLQLDKVYPKKQYDYTAELISGVMDGLKSNGAYNFNYTMDFNEIFGQYSQISDEAGKWTQRPYSAFKVTFSIDHIN